MMVSEISGVSTGVHWQKLIVLSITCFDPLLRRSPDKVIVLEEMKKHVGDESLLMVVDGWTTRDVEVTRWQHGAVELKEALTILCFRTSRHPRWRAPYAGCSLSTRRSA